MIDLLLAGSARICFLVMQQAPFITHVAVDGESVWISKATKFVCNPEDDDLSRVVAAPGITQATGTDRYANVKAGIVAGLFTHGEKDGKDRCAGDKFCC